MESDKPFSTILLKISGEAFSDKEKAISQEGLDYILGEIIPVYEIGVRIGVVVGGGNIIRGAKSFTSLDREGMDYAGMIGTCINGLILYHSLLKRGIDVSIFSGLEVKDVIPQYRGEHFRGIAVFCGGTGRPFFTTDTAAVLRALQIKADILIKATKVDGVFSEDPEKNPDAEFFPELSYKEAIEKGLQIMDITAFSLAMEHKLPISVINFFKAGSLRRFVSGERVGSIIK